jgi:hypothetical protein
MSIGETLGTITNIEVILATHVATQTYGVYTQWWPHANWQKKIQTTHKTRETMSTCKQFLYCGKLGHIPSACPNKRVQHATRTTTSTIIQGLEKKRNKDV